MEIKASAKFIRISPKKVRLVVDVIRGMTIDRSLDQLKFINKKSVTPIEKLIMSAVANAEHNFKLEKDNLFIKEIKVDEGPKLKRWLPRAHGRATPIWKRMSHIDITLAEIKDSGKKEAVKQKVEEPVKLTTKPKKDEGIVVKDKKDEQKEKTQPETGEAGKKIVDPRGEGKGRHTKIEGGAKGFSTKMFRRKSG